MAGDEHTFAVDAIGSCALLDDGFDEADVVDIPAARDVALGLAARVPRAADPIRVHDEESVAVGQVIVNTTGSEPRHRPVAATPVEHDEERRAGPEVLRHIGEEYAGPAPDIAHIAHETPGAVRHGLRLARRCR